MSEIQPALLTRSEIDWLLGNKRVSRSYERKLRHFMKKKIETLTELEIPLLLDRGFNVTTYSNGVTANGDIPEIGQFSLVGRGIANPEVKSDNVISDKKKNGAVSGNIVPIAPFSAFPPRHFEPRVLSDMGLANNYS